MRRIDKWINKLLGLSLGLGIVSLISGAMRDLYQPVFLVACFIFLVAGTALWVMR